MEAEFSESGDEIIINLPRGASDLTEWRVDYREYGIIPLYVNIGRKPKFSARVVLPSDHGDLLQTFSNFVLIEQAVEVAKLYIDFLVRSDELSI